MKTRFVSLLLVLLFVLSIIPANAAESEPVRAVWAPTVYALDYPSSYTTSEATLKKDIDNLLNNVQNLGYNTLFFQVRPSGDAFYNSSIFPWSKYISGTQGKAPENGFDPLSYVTAEAHKRNIELHAWLNPYRITATAADNDKLASNSIPQKYPDLVVKHTDGKLYLNPGEPAANKLIVDGVLEIIRNYDVDGIHLDDYFYPDENFPDNAAFKKYGSDYANISDWRRNNVTSLIKSIHSAIKAEKPDVIFSVSPAGIWANKSTNPNGSDTNGKQTYYAQYADTRLWVKEEFVDWIMPQIYWNIGYSIADFEVVSKWWESVVAGTHVKLCIGQAVYKAADETKTDSVWYGAKGAAELRQQNDLIKDLQNYNGYSHYRLASVLSSAQLTEYAKAVNAANTPVITPETPQPETPQPETPQPETPQPETPQPETPQPETPQPETPQPETPQPETPQPETPQPETPQPETPQPETPQPETPQPETPQPETPQPETPQPETPQPETPQPETPQASLFSDLDVSPWAKDSILALYNKGIIKGMDDGTFGCRRQVTRADFTIMLVRILGKDAKVLTNFKDVTSDKYYYHEIGVARVMGLTTGRDGVVFDPTGKITREDMATLVYRLLEKEKKLNIDESFDIDAKFTDSDKISGYAKDAVKAMCSMELLSGYDTGDFQPKGLATRAETAVFLNRVSQLF